MALGPVSKAIYFMGASYAPPNDSTLTRENADGTIAWSKLTPNMNTGSFVVNSAETAIYMQIANSNSALARTFISVNPQSGDLIFWKTW